MNVRWLHAPLLGAMVLAGTLMGTSTAQAQPRVEFRVEVGQPHRYYDRYDRRHARYDRYGRYDRVVRYDRYDGYDRYDRRYDRGRWVRQSYRPQRYCWYDRYDRPHYYYR
jgi:hypothetical protein